MSRKEKMFDIRITKIPEGPAPEWVRKEWVDIILKAKNILRDHVEVDFLENKIHKNRGGFSVNASHAINRLSKKSQSAANWFKDNLPSYVKSFAFGPDEAEKLTEMFKHLSKFNFIAQSDKKL